MAVAEYGARFPRLGRDDLEQFLLEEAVLGAYHYERRREEERQAKRLEAREKASRLLREHRGGLS